MLSYVLRRLLGVIPILVGISVISFALIHLAPGKPTTVEQAMNPRVSPEVRLKLEKLYGLDKPLRVQYLRWLSSIARLDFGRSLTDDRPVTERIAERIPVTLGINVSSLALILLIGVPLGVKCAVRRNGAFDRMMTAATFISFAMPGFWLALLLMNFLGVHLRWLPVSGLTSLDYEYLSPWGRVTDVARHLALPLVVSSIAGIAGIARYMRSSMIEVLSQPYVCAARAQGLPGRMILYRYALRNALLPIVTILGLSIPGLLGGSVIIESLFAIPGIGQLFYEAVMARDYPLIMAEVILGAVLTMIGNLAADIGYACADPRIRYRK